MGSPMPIFKPGQPRLPSNITVLDRRRVDMQLLRECVDAVAAAGILSGDAEGEDANADVVSMVSSARSSRMNSTGFQQWWNDIFARETAFWTGVSPDKEFFRQSPDLGSGISSSWLPAVHGQQYRLRVDAVQDQAASALARGWDVAPAHMPVPTFPPTAVVIGRQGEVHPCFCCKHVWVHVWCMFLTQPAPCFFLTCRCSVGSSWAHGHLRPCLAAATWAHRLCEG